MLQLPSTHPHASTPCIHKHPHLTFTCINMHPHALQCINMPPYAFTRNQSSKCTLMHMHPHLVLLADGSYLFEGVKCTQHCSPCRCSHKKGHLRHTQDLSMHETLTNCCTHAMHLTLDQCLLCAVYMFKQQTHIHSLDAMQPPLSCDLL